MTTLENTGERQVSTEIGGIREDHRQRYEWIAQQISPTQRVLDAGCGVGYGSTILARNAKSLRSVDIDPDVVAFARENWGQSNISYSAQDLHFFTAPDNEQYDVIVALEVIEHLVDPRLFLMRAKRHLAPDGKIFLSVPNQSAIQHTIELNAFHIRHYTPEEIIQTVSVCGYTVQKIHAQTKTNTIEEGTDGVNLLIEATPTDALPVPDEILKEMETEALGFAGYQINARANVVAAQKRRIRALTTRLQEKTIEARTSTTEKTTIQEKLKSVEESLLAVAQQTEQSTNAIESVSNAESRLNSQAKRIDQLAGQLAPLQEKTESVDQKYNHRTIKINDRVNNLEKKLAKLTTESRSSTRQKQNPETPDSQQTES